MIIEQMNGNAVPSPPSPHGPAGQRSRNAIAQNRSLAHKSVAWCPGRESYATTDTTDRCLSLAWWRECLARWRRFANRETHYRGSPVLLSAGGLARWEPSLWPAGSRRLSEPLAQFKSWARNTPARRNGDQN